LPTNFFAHFARSPSSCRDIGGSLIHSFSPDGPKEFILSCPRFLFRTDSYGKL
jgi:hypothetical protein